MTDIADDDLPAGPSLMRRFLTRLANAFPAPGTVIGLGFFWGLGMAASALVSLFVRLHFGMITPVPVMSLYFCGAAVAAPLALFVSELLFCKSGRPVRFLGSMVIMAGATLAMTAFLFAMQYRVYYAQWHWPLNTRVGVFQFVFTSVSAVYQFAVLGGKLYLPVAPAFLVAFSTWFAMRAPKATR